MHGLSVDCGADSENNAGAANAADDRQIIEEQVQKQQTANEQLEASLQNEKKEVEGAWLSEQASAWL